MSLTIAIDVSGGDKAPHITLNGVAHAAKELPQVKFKLYVANAHRSEFSQQSQSLSPYQSRIETIFCEDYIDSDMKPTAALRMARTSSMGQAIFAVLDGQADGVVSAGNTGAYMALAKVILKTCEGIDRPAIAGLMPNTSGTSIMLDMGANVDCSSDILFQFALMGEVFAKIMLHKTNPSVGLLNIGEEQLKGNAAVKEAHALIRENLPHMNYHGFIEGDDIMNGTTDVVVTDGFTGNVSLKTIEGTVKFFTGLLKNEINKSKMAKLGALIARGTFSDLKTLLDPRKYNGALLIGLNGIVVKSHGGTDDFGFSRAIHVAAELAQNNAISQIKDGLAAIMQKN